MDSLVSSLWLAAELGKPDLVVVDASWFMPASGRSGHDEYAKAHIPGARFLDIDALSDRESALPHTLPRAALFGKVMEQLGVGRYDRIVVYDNSPLRTAARGWFMLRHFGASKVAILDGGFQKWTAEGRPTESGVAVRREVTFDAIEHDELVTKEELLTGSRLPWLDARGRARFEGSEADPRPGVEAGHAPNARNLPFGVLYREDGTFLPRAELRKTFEAAGIDPTKPFVASCGSGVTANSLIFAAHLLGNDEARLYDGSWSDWGSDPHTPKVLGRS